MNDTYSDREEYLKIPGNPNKIRWKIEETAFILFALGMAITLWTLSMGLVFLIVVDWFTMAMLIKVLSIGLSLLGISSVILLITYHMPVWIPKDGEWIK